MIASQIFRSRPVEPPSCAPSWQGEAVASRSHAPFRFAGLAHYRATVLTPAIMYQECTVPNAEYGRLGRDYARPPPAMPRRSRSLAGSSPRVVCHDALRCRSEGHGRRRASGDFARFSRKSPSGRLRPRSAPLRAASMLETPGSRKVAGDSGSPYRGCLVCRLALDVGRCRRYRSSTCVYLVLSFRATARLICFGRVSDTLRV